jgi:hypothetical protein
MSDSGPKSAYELAMERLEKKDVDEGVERATVTDEQRTAIAEVRNFYEAKLAEREVLHRSALMRTIDAAARATLEQEYRWDRDRLVSERESKIQRIRGA